MVPPCQLRDFLNTLVSKSTPHNYMSYIQLNPVLLDFNLIDFSLLSYLVMFSLILILSPFVLNFSSGLTLPENLTSTIR